MVYLKVSDGSETRKFQVNPNEVTFDQLKERLTSFFPNAINGGQSDLSLQYRDKDGDIITLSSNQELQEALSQLPEEAVWKLHIKNNPQATHKTHHHRPTQQQQHRQRRCHNVSIFEPAWRPFGLFSNPWATFDREFAETLQLAQILENHLFQQNSDKEEDKKDTTATTATNDKEATNTENGSTEKSSSDEDPEVVKSKPEAEPTKTTQGEKSTNDGDGDDAAGPHVRHWGMWEPRVLVSPFGFRTVLGPVGYSIRWGPSQTTQSGGCCGGKREDKKEETVSKENTSASPTAEEKTTESQASPEEPKSEATTTSD